MYIYVLTVMLMSSDPPKLYVEQTYDTMAECHRWADFYREYPFYPKCTKFKVMK